MICFDRKGQCRFFIDADPVLCWVCIGVTESGKRDHFHFLNLLLSTPSDIQSIKTLKVYCCSPNLVDVHRILSFQWSLGAGNSALSLWIYRRLKSLIRKWLSNILWKVWREIRLSKQIWNNSDRYFKSVQNILRSK